MSKQNKLPREVLATRLGVKEGDTLRLDEAALPPHTRGQRHDRALRGSDAAELQRFATFMEAGDELWTWASPEWTWKELMGRGGFAIVRDGEPVRYWMTVMN
jgi:hypothetical protein